VKYIFNVFGSIFLIVGVVGIFLPLLPTTPFLLVSAAMFFRGSEKLYTKLMEHPYLGTYIAQYRIHKAIPLKAKVISITFLWLTILFSAFFVVPLWWVKILLIGIAIAVTFHILSYKTWK